MVNSSKKTTCLLIIFDLLDAFYVPKLAPDHSQINNKEEDTPSFSFPSASGLDSSIAGSTAKGDTENMELFSPDFFSALLAIVVIDLVLAGDNAIVIALAARNLPAHLRTKAIVWGTVGAIVVRSSMTVAVVWLLKIPGLLLVGGVMLLWIAYKLLINPDNGEEHKVNSATNFWSAMRTIVVADAVMGLDNVLAVAGAAQGSFLLVVLGLLISIPIVIWGSQLILKYAQKYPAIVYVGAGVLVWTGVKMMTGEPALKEYVAAMGNLIWLVYPAVMAGIMFAGFRANHVRVRDRVAAHIVDLTETPVPGTVVRPVLNQGGNTVLKVLIPVDGSKNAMQAVRHVVNRFLSHSNIEVHLLHVRAAFSRHVSQFTSRKSRDSYHREVAERAIKSAQDLLQQHKVPHAVHIEFGDKAETIHRAAQRLRVDQIVMGTARKNSLTRLIEDSVTNRVLEITRVPVEVIAGAEASKLEKYALPAGVGAALAAIIVTVD
jgi:YjbE family integral membrane protein